MEPFDLMRDFARSASCLARRVQTPRPAEGVDYTTEDYRNQVRRAVGRLHPRTMSLRVTSILRETPTTRTFRFVRTDDKLPPWRAGQYVNLHVTVDGIRTSRPYSISNPPGDPYLDLTIREKADGFVTRHLFDHVQTGDRFESSGPAGRFQHQPLIDQHGLVFIAGGSGITPIMAMIRDFARTGWPLPLYLLYGSRNLADTIFRDELDALSAQNPNFSYALVLSEPEAQYGGVTGFITADLIRAHVGERDLSRFSVMVCGPNAMYDFVSGELSRLPVQPHRIRRELYGPPPQVHLAPGWPQAVGPQDTVTVEVPGRARFTATAGEPLLNALERHGLKLRSMCRSGACSYCRAKLVSGEVFCPPLSGRRECDRESGYIHTCVSYPVSDVVIRF